MTLQQHPLPAGQIDDERIGLATMNDGQGEWNDGERGDDQKAEDSRDVRSYRRWGCCSSHDDLQSRPIISMMVIGRVGRGGAVYSLPRARRPRTPVKRLCLDSGFLAISCQRIGHRRFHPFNRAGSDMYDDSIDDSGECSAGLGFKELDVTP